MPKQINTYRYAQALVRLFNLKGRFQPVLDETIVPVIDIGQAPLIRRAMAGGLVSAIALEKSHVTLKNLGGTNKDIFVTQASFVLGLNGNVHFDVPTPGATLGSAVAQPTQWADSHEPGTPNTTATPGRTSVLAGGHDAAAIGAMMWPVGTTAANGLYLNPFHVKLHPGGSCMWNTASNNTALFWALEWYEQDVTEG